LVPPAWGKPEHGTVGKPAGMVKTQQIGTIGSQVLRAALPMDAVHRLNGSRLSAPALGLRYSRAPPTGGMQEDVSAQGLRACMGLGSTAHCKVCRGSRPPIWNNRGEPAEGSLNMQTTTRTLLLARRR
jgi:hypothetical protein